MLSKQSSVRRRQRGSRAFFSRGLSALSRTTSAWYFSLAYFELRALIAATMTVSHCSSVLSSHCPRSRAAAGGIAVLVCADELPCKWAREQVRHELAVRGGREALNDHVEPVADRVACLAVLLLLLLRLSAVVSFGFVASCGHPLLLGSSGWALPVLPGQTSPLWAELSPSSGLLREYRRSWWAFSCGCGGLRNSSRGRGHRGRPWAPLLQWPQGAALGRRGATGSGFASMGGVSRAHCSGLASTHGVST